MRSRESTENNNELQRYKEKTRAKAIHVVGKIMYISWFWLIVIIIVVCAAICED